MYLFAWVCSKIRESSCICVDHSEYTKKEKWKHTYSERVNQKLNGWRAKLFSSSRRWYCSFDFSQYSPHHWKQNWPSLHQLFASVPIHHLASAKGNYFALLQSSTKSSYCEERHVMGKCWFGWWISVGIVPQEQLNNMIWIAVKFRSWVQILAIRH